MPTATSLMIVDDEVVIRTTLAQIFQQAGYRVQMAADGFEALAHMRSMTPDVLLSDLNMPGMSGFELLSVVRRRLPSVYVIATSGAYKGDDVPEGIAADAFYEKASNFGGLLRMVRAAAIAPTAHASRQRTDAPLWITGVSDEEESESFGMISCSECLRAYVVRLLDGGLVVQETACRDCETPIRFAVVKPLDPKTSQPYVTKAMPGLHAVARKMGGRETMAAGRPFMAPRATG